MAGGGPAGWPFAGMYSTVLDLARFANAFVNAGRLDGRQALTATSVARLATPVAPFQSGDGDYAYGLRVYKHRGVDVVEHGGVDPVGGYRSLIYMVPSRRVAVVVLANRAGRRPYAIADAALDALLPGALSPVPAIAAVVPMDSVEMARLADATPPGWSCRSRWTMARSRCTRAPRRCRSTSSPTDGTSHAHRMAESPWRSCAPRMVP
jgi:Beta-lactamase class C and other penicillin binding proteins